MSPYQHIVIKVKEDKVIYKGRDLDKLMSYSIEDGYFTIVTGPTAWDKIRESLRTIYTVIIAVIKHKTRNLR